MPINFTTYDNGLGRGRLESCAARWHRADLGDVVLATHKEDVAPAELKKRAEAHMSKMAETHRTRTA